MAETDRSGREGSLEAPTRLAIDWRSEEYRDEEALYTEMERIFDICSGCRRCFSLCNSFPTMFDMIDESETMDLEGVDRKAYWDVVDHCYLCDMCYMSKCPYVPPHPWNVDFPHLMLRAKAFRHEREGTSMRNKVLSSTDTVGRFAGIPVVVKAVNAANKSGAGRKLLDKTLGVHPEAVVPQYHSDTLRKRFKNRPTLDVEAEPTEGTRGRVALFTTCYGNYNKPQIGEDLIKVFEHNGIPVRIAGEEHCCGMPKLELGDLEAVEKLKDFNIPRLTALVDGGWDIVAPVPSCVLMFKQELPLMFPKEAAVAKVRDAIYDPFEYLMLRYKAEKLKTEFPEPLGKIAYHVPCHLRVQNIGYKTRDILKLIPDTEVQTIERCSGHNGTYAVKREFHDTSMKIGRPVFNRVKKSEAAYYASDCPMAADQIQNGLDDAGEPEHPLSLLRRAYGL